MAKVEPIASFPVEIDRSHFASWLSGFIDGEGCFLLYAIRRKHWAFPAARFAITLRADDLETLQLIQAYWGCGNVFDRIKAAKSKSKPQACYQVNRSRDLRRVVIPHFEQYPLVAKKRRDFHLWASGVRLMHESRANGSRSLFGVHGGTTPYWTDENLKAFAGIRESLRTCRRYKIADESRCTVTPTPRPKKSQVCMF